MILLTGASGFIGGALLHELTRRGKAVRPVYRVLPDAADSTPAVAIASMDMTTDWRAALQGAETVVHCAARVHVMRDTASDPLEKFRRTNVAGTLALARQAADAGVKRFVFLSSIKVNGESTAPGAAFTADDAPAPEDAYGISKAEAEAGLREIASQTGMEVVIIRPVLVYGPGVKGNFQTMVRWIQRGVPLPLGGVTNNRRSLVALGNLVDLICTCLDHPHAAGQIFLASDGEDLSSADLLRRIATAQGVFPRLLPVPPVLLHWGARLLGKHAVAQRLLGSLQVDISKTRKLLDWQPPFTVDQALKKLTESK